MLHCQNAPAIVPDATACMIIASSVVIANFEVNEDHGLLMVYPEASSSCNRERAPYRLIMNLIAKK